MDLEEKNTLFKIRRTVLEMILDRKYIIPLSENIDFEEFIIKYNNKNLDIHIFDENKVGTLKCSNNIGWCNKT